MAPLAPQFIRTVCTSIEHMFALRDGMLMFIPIAVAFLLKAEIYSLSAALCNCQGLNCHIFQLILLHSSTHSLR